MGVNALFTAVSGLDSNQSYLGTIGNNIANSNTIGFKSSDPIFENLVSQTLGGTSNSQEGLGTDVFSIQSNYAQGGLENTTNPLNMAIDGNGFFVVQSPSGSTYYTRNGQFSENASGQIVDSTDQNVVMGYALNSDGSSSGTGGTPTAISLNTAAIQPKQTSGLNLTANLNSNITPQVSTGLAYPTTAGSANDNTFMGGYITNAVASGAGDTADTALNVSGMTYNGPNLGTPASSSTSTTNQVPTSLLIGNGDGTTNAYGVATYVVGTTDYNYYSSKPAAMTGTGWVSAGYYSISGGNGTPLPNGSSISSVILSGPLSSSVIPNTAISQADINVASTTGLSSGNYIQINANGNTGTDAYQFLNTVASVVSQSSPTTSGTVALSNAMPASYDIKSTATTGGYNVISGPSSDYYSAPINVYDSLGNALPLTVTFAPSSSTTGDWNVYYSIDGTAYQRESYGSIGTSTAFDTPDVTFTSKGAINTGQSLTLYDTPGYVSSTPGTLPDTANAMSISLNLDNLTQYAANSAATAFTQNGYTTGTLTSFTVDQSGRISGLFSNGQQEYLYQVALADFIAPTGLVSQGNSLYSESYASGQPTYGVASSGNFGYITDSALEQSNVDISSEFTNMIIAQNAYVANSKVLTTENSVLASLESSVQ